MGNEDSKAELAKYIKIITDAYRDNEFTTWERLKYDGYVSDVAELTYKLYDKLWRETDKMRVPIRSRMSRKEVSSVLSTVSSMDNTLKYLFDDDSYTLKLMENIIAYVYYDQLNSPPYGPPNE